MDVESISSISEWGTARKRCLKWPSATHVLPRQTCIPRGVSVSCGPAGSRHHSTSHKHSGCWERKMCPGQAWSPCGNTADSLCTQCHRVGTMTSQKPRCQAGKAHKATCMPACSCRNCYSIDICGCPQASPETDVLTTRVLKFSILTGALRTGKQRTFFSGGMTFGSRKLRVGPEKGLGGTDSLLELHHSNRNSQMAVAHRVRQPSASLFFLLKAVSY